MITYLYYEPQGLLTVQHAKSFIKEGNARNWVSENQERFKMLRLDGEVSVNHVYDWRNDERLCEEKV